MHSQSQNNIPFNDYLIEQRRKQRVKAWAWQYPTSPNKPKSCAKRLSKPNRSNNLYEKVDRIPAPVYAEGIKSCSEAFNHTYFARNAQRSNE